MKHTFLDKRDNFRLYKGTLFDGGTEMYLLYKGKTLIAYSVLDTVPDLDSWIEDTIEFHLRRIKDLEQELEEMKDIKDQLKRLKKLWHSYL